VLKTGQSTRTMTAHNQWIALLTCPNGGEPGTVHLSQPDGRVGDVSVEALRQVSKSFALNLAKPFTVRPAISQQTPNTID
jgi:hypothetical protein